MLTMAGGMRFFPFTSATAQSREIDRCDADVVAKVAARSDNYDRANIAMAPMGCQRTGRSV